MTARTFVRRCRTRAVEAVGIGALLATALLVGACAPSTPPTATPNTAPSTPSGPAAPGTVLAVTPIADLDRAGVAAAVVRGGLGAARVSSGVRTARLEYATVTPDGAPTRASALVAVPENPGPAPLRTVSWQHGTIGFRGATASTADGSDRAAATMFAAAGFLVSAPDYLGLGTGPGPQAYSNNASGVTASLDALRAARSWAATGGQALDNHVMLAGFSEGGPVSMGLGHAVADGALPGTVLGGLAGIDGPYDFSRTVATALAGPVPNASAYMANLVVSWNRLHHLYDRPGDAFRPPYENVENLLDGDHPTQAIMAGLPATVPELLTPAFLDRFRHPDGVLRSALDQEGTSCDWSPTVPVSLYHARGDHDVPFFNTEYCRAALAGRGATVTVHDTGDVPHNTSSKLALPQVLDGFLRN